MIKNRKIGFRLIKSITFSILIVLVFFMSLEGVQRIRYLLRFKSAYWLCYGFARMPPDYREIQERGLEKERLGLKVIEVVNIHYDGYRKLNPACNTVDYKINSFGFRGDEFDLNKKENTRRIVALGGSTTFGTGVKDGFTYPEFLQRILTEKSGRTYEVINAGIGASTIAEISNLFEKEIAALKPDIIIINSLANNFYYSSNAYKYKSNLAQKLNQFLLQKSLFYMTLREKIAYILHGYSGDIYKASAETMLDNFMSDDSFWAEMKNSFEKIIKNAKANGTQVIIVKQPVWLRTKDEDKNRGILYDVRLKPIYEKAYALFDEFKQKENIEVVEAQSFFETIPEKRKFFTSDGLHLTEKGNERLAELISRKIIP